MTKGTPSFGKHNKGAPHRLCRRCGNRSFHIQKRRCSSCRFGLTTKMRSYKWRKQKNFSDR